MLNLKKFTLGFSCACLLAFSSSLCFASGSPKTVVPATNLPEATINTTIDMSRSISQNITAVPATNLSDEIINTKIDMSRSTDSQNITTVPATNLPDEEIDTSVSFY